jgi:prevent-host-death family protein
MLTDRPERPSVSATELRKNISEHIGRVRHGRERLVIEKNSKPAAALISYKDLELLEALEDRLDVLLAEKVLAEKGPRVSIEEAEKLLGL